MSLNWFAKIVFCLALFQVCSANNDTISVVVIEGQFDAVNGTKVSIVCTANGTALNRIPGARLMRNDGIEWKTSDNGRVSVETKVDLVSFVEKLKITWDPILLKDKSVLNLDGHRCQVDSISVGFNVNVHASNETQLVEILCNGKNSNNWKNVVMRNFRLVVIACGLFIVALLVFMAVVIFVRKRKQNTYEKMKSEKFYAYN